MTVAETLKRYSDFLDTSRPSVQVIRVCCVRRTLLRAGAEAKERGGPLFYRGRLVIPLHGRGALRS